MPTFKILKRIDSYVDYTCRIEAPSLEAAVDLAYEDQSPVKWTRRDVIEFDACRVVALDDNGDEVEGYVRGKG